MERNLQYLQQDYDALFGKLESKKDSEKPVQQIGDKISALATKVIVNLTDEEGTAKDGNLFTKLKTVADQITTWDTADLPKVFADVAQHLTQDLTNFEFTKSGLLQALANFFTDQRPQVDPKEESKDDPPEQETQITPEKAVKYLKCFKYFVDAICQKKQGKLPFRHLLILCHE